MGKVSKPQPKSDSLGKGTHEFCETQVLSQLYNPRTTGSLEQGELLGER